MTGPAEAVFDGVLIPELVPYALEPLIAEPEPQRPNQSDPRPEAEMPSPSKPSFDCSHDCKDACQRPDNCLQAEAQQQVQSLLDSMSLDAMIDLASDTLEQRTRSRLDRHQGG